MRSSYIPNSEQKAHASAEDRATSERFRLVQCIRRVYVEASKRHLLAQGRRLPREPILNGLGLTARQWHAFVTGESGPLPYSVIERAIKDARSAGGSSEVRMLWMRDCLASHGFPTADHVLTAAPNATAFERVRDEVEVLRQMLARNSVEVARNYSEQMLPQWIDAYRYLRSRGCPDCLGPLVAAFKAVQNLEFRDAHYLRAYRSARRAAWLGRKLSDLEAGELYLLVAANLAKHGLSLGQGKVVRRSYGWFERAEHCFRTVIATAADERSRVRAALLLGRSLCLRCWPVAWSGNYVAALDLLHEASQLSVGRFERLHSIVVLSHLYKLKVLVGSSAYEMLLYSEISYLTRVDSETGHSIPDVFEEPVLAWPSIDELEGVSLSADQIASFKRSALERFYRFGEPPRRAVPHDLNHLLLHHLPISDEWKRHLDELGVGVGSEEAE